MIRTTSQWLISNIYYTVWYILHVSYQVQLEIRDFLRFNVKYVSRRLMSCFPLYSHEKEFSNFVDSVSTLTKIPKHLAISVIPDTHESALSVLLKRLWFIGQLLDKTDKKKDDNSLQTITHESDGLNLQSLAKIVAWASAANIPVVSLYDYKGILKKRYKELGCHIQDEIAQDFWAIKQSRQATEHPLVKFHNVHKSSNGFVNGNGHINGYTNGVNGTKHRETVHIFVYSRNDGKPAIVNAVKDIYLEKFEGQKHEIEQNGNIISPLVPQKSKLSDHCVDEATLDSYLNRYNGWPNSIAEAKTEPDLLLILGNVKSTLGFLPWHIRLTEIHWLPSLKRVELSDFIGSLYKFAKCQQRFGK